ncbi:cyclin-dependent kinase 11B-like isoform X2 [Ornithodoros turicata]|uniref:cyclin-dependent kinase 11B-like isoform X2 n=1 Tax=Ornithodoros turicata TaxID=34597 RepID=UPI0031395B84
MSRNSNDSEEDGEIDREETRYNVYGNSQSAGKGFVEQNDDSYDTEDGSEDALNIQPPQAAIPVPKRDRRDRKREKHSRKHESSRSRKDRRHSSRERGGSHRDSRRAGEGRGGHSRDQRDAHERDSTRHRQHRAEEKSSRVEPRPRATSDKEGRANEKEQRPARDSGRSSARQEVKELPPSREVRDARERIREAREAREREEKEQTNPADLERERFLYWQQNFTRVRRERLQREWRKERLMVVDQSLSQRDREREQRRLESQRRKRDDNSKPQQYVSKAEEQATARDRSRSPISHSRQTDDQSGSDPGISLEIEDDPLTDMEEDDASSPPQQRTFPQAAENNVAQTVVADDTSSNDDENEEDSEKTSSDTTSDSSSDSDDSSSSTDSEDDDKNTEEEKVDGDASEKNNQSNDKEAAAKNDVAPAEPPTPSIDDILSQFPPYLPAIQGCRSVEEFHCLNRIEEGTYGVVYRARDKQTNEIVALKRLKMEKEKEGFPITSLREINTLLKAQHPNIVTVREIVVGSNMDKIYIAMEYVEHDLKSLMEVMKQPFLVGEVKTLMLQLLRAVAHLHDNWILHRDLKTSNLLLSHKGILKVGDFGLAREYGSPLKHYTPIVVTLWYRAPELLLGVKEYSTPIDMWSVGCIFGELLTMKPLFPGKSDIDQLNRIFKDLGTPSEKIWPGYSELPLVRKVTFTEYPYNSLRGRFGHTLSNLGFDLLNKFLTYYPSQRITAEDALRHEFFKETPVPVEPSMFPTWPAKSELGHRKAQSPKPPSGGKQFAKQLGEGDEEGLLAAAAGFHMKIPNKGSSAQGTGFRLKF